MAFTEFCCRSGGSNLNAGTRTGNSTEPGTGASLTYASGTWVQATRVFTVASGNPTSDGVAVGDFASVYPDAATVAVYIGRVSARTTTTITIDATAKIGTSPADGTTNTTLKIGGAWKGPNGAEIFPFNLMTNALISASNIFPRINFKNDADYVVSASCANSGQQMVWQGYSSSYGDGGRATFDGGTTGAGYNVINTSGVSIVVDSIIVKNNGDSGNGVGIAVGGGRSIISRCVGHDLRGFGIAATSHASVVECETYACNQSNTASQGGISLAGGSFAIRCIAHDNSGSNSYGFVCVTGVAAFIDCIADTNGSAGFGIASTSSITILSCNSYANVGSGINAIGHTGAVYIENCNLIKNGGYGYIGAANVGGFLLNCAYGAGTQANTLGTSNTLGTVVESGSINYASDVTPWVDPANGDFRINLAAAKATARSLFTQTAASYTGTLSYRDMGATQHLENNPIGGGVFPGMGVQRSGNY